MSVEIMERISSQIGFQEERRHRLGGGRWEGEVAPRPGEGEEPLRLQPVRLRGRGQAGHRHAQDPRQTGMGFNRNGLLTFWNG